MFSRSFLQASGFRELTRTDRGWPDETTMGFGFPKEERDALIAAEPGEFALPRLSDQRFHWVQARMGALEPGEMGELVIDAWRMRVPKKVAAARLG